MNTADIIIFCGQSNMQGQSEQLSECSEVVGAFEYKLLDGALVPLSNPVGEDIRYDGRCGENLTIESDQSKWLSEHALGSSCYGHTNLVPSFCRAYIKETAVRAVAVHAAKGSTEIKDWLPDSDGYQMLVSKVNSAIRKANEVFLVENIYFVWLQGESDAIASNSKAYYKEKLKILAGSLKNDIAISRFCIIRVGAFTGDARDNEIIDAQDEICKEDSFFVMLTDIAAELNKDPSMMNPYVRGHFSAKGLEALGSLAGKALEKYR